MNRAVLLALPLVALGWLTGCSLIIGDKPLDIVTVDASTADGSGGSGSGGSSDAGTERAAADASADAASFDVQQGSSFDASAADAGSADGPTPTCSPDGSTATDPAFEWAQWPMPNSPSDPGAPNAVHYIDNHDGTVTDAVTQLVWEQLAPAAIYSQSQAASWCGTLSLGGSCDWRLPTEVELLSIVDVSQGAPTIDATQFAGTPAHGWFWSSTGAASRDPDGGAMGWGVNFQYGNAIAQPADSKLYVRCVRGRRANPVSAPARYVHVGPSVVRDTQTGLAWQTGNGGQAVLADATTYCGKLALNEVGWRVPTMKELWTLVDVSQGNADAGPGTMMDPTTFPGEPAEAFWAYPTSGPSGATSAWGVDFLSGRTNPQVPAATLLDVRCVH